MSEKLLLRGKHEPLPLAEVAHRARTNLGTTKAPAPRARWSAGLLAGYISPEPARARHVANPLASHICAHGYFDHVTQKPHSYYGAFHADEALFFFPHHVPASPELPFGLIASPEPEQAPGARQSAFQEYGGAVPPGAMAAAGAVTGGTNIHRRVMDVLSRMGGAGRAPTWRAAAGSAT
uniref:Uncharacterized protein n=1 Tax=Oryza punctata TaxID=4537 RepID=A0A0E0KIV0_ORYPU